MKQPIEETYLDETYEDGTGGSDRTSRYRIIGLVGGVVVVFCCLSGLVAAWLGRAPAAKIMAALSSSATPSVTETSEPTETPTFTVVPPSPTIGQPTNTLAPAVSPTPNRLPAAEVMAVVTGPPVMKDDFADNSRNWIAQGEGSDFTIQNGLLRLHNARQNNPAAAYCTGDCGPYKDYYYYQAEVTEERPGNAGLGLLMAFDNIRNAGYVFEVKPSTGEYRLGKMASGKVTPLVDWKGTTAVLPNPQANLLGLAYQNGILTPYINGARMDSVKDASPLTEGRVGFWVDQEGSPLLGGHASVFTLFPTTPTPPGMASAASSTPAPTYTIPAAGFPTPTNPVPGAPVQPPPPGQALPTTPPAPQVPVIPTPTRALASPTSTPIGACPASFPKGTWMLQIFKQTPGKMNINIDGTKYTIVQGVNPFYLTQNAVHTVHWGDGKGRTFDIITKCVIKYMTIN